MIQAIIKFINQDQGATAVEYAIMVSLIAGVIVAAVALLGGNTQNLFQDAADKIANP